MEKREFTRQEWGDFKDEFHLLLADARLEKLYDNRYSIEIELGKGVIKAKPEGTSFDKLMVFASDTKILEWSLRALGFLIVNKGRISHILDNRN